MAEWLSRTELLIGAEGIERLSKARVAVFGIGGVGGYVVEALARSGVGMLDLIDNDRVCESNLNRQIIATRSSIGKYKVEAARDRILDIYPEAVVKIYKTFYLPETADTFDFTQFDYVVDAIDTITGKIQLVVQAQKAGTPIISAMGAGNKLDPAAFCVADIYQTSVCPLAKVMRRELKKRGITHLKVVYSKEQAMTPQYKEFQEKDSNSQFPENGENAAGKRRTTGSIAFVPSAAGLVMAGEVVRDLIHSHFHQPEAMHCQIPLP